jgi:hypothetical protein
MTCALALLLLAAAPAEAAAEPAFPDPPTTIPSATATGAGVPTQLADASPSPQDTASLEPERIEVAELAQFRGGQTLVVGNQTLTAVTSGNVLNGDYTAGSVSLSDNAFANFNGIGNLAINTGAQVSLQSGMSVVINVQP